MKVLSLQHTGMKNNINLCDSCKKNYPKCDSRYIIFGTGVGQDNICACSIYEPLQKKGPNCITEQGLKHIESFIKKPPEHFSFNKCESITLCDTCCNTYPECNSGNITFDDGTITSCDAYYWDNRS